jgi:hypothetical protein
LMPASSAACGSTLGGLKKPSKLTCLLLPGVEAGEDDSAGGGGGTEAASVTVLPKVFAGMGSFGGWLAVCPGLACGQPTQNIGKPRVLMHSGYRNITGYRPDKLAKETRGHW